MDVITTHINADFDCLGAMVAAKKLYPEALMVFSGSQEKSMRDFFLKSTGYALNFTRIRDLDMDRITRLIMVDCQHSSRIGRFAEIINKPGLEIHIYDHHPGSSGDVTPTGGVIRDCGASTTILTTILRDQRIEVSATEATLMMLGIYEDTGSLTFPATSVDDYLAAAWLLERGANLNTVADFVTQELTAAQVSLLNDLLKSLKTTTLNGVDVSIAHASVDYYIGDIAVLAHMMRDMENLQALFLVVGMGSRVYIVARSRIPEVNVGDLLREFGGGGHSTAASATVRELTLIQVLAKLEETLRMRVNPLRTARDIMSSPVKTMPVTTSIEEGRELLTRYNLNAMPVMDGNRIVGIISRRIVEKALYHNLGSLTVTEYMHTEFRTAAPDTPIPDIQEYFVGWNRRFMPIFEGEELVGAVTRTDILRHICSEDALYDLANDSMPVHSREVERLMHKHLLPRVVQMLRDLGGVGDQLDLPVYVVGGFVRDLLLGIENYDIDVTVEGDGILFAETFAGRFGCRVKSHRKFGTAVIIFNEGFKVDVASTRLEYYESPGALPTVERSSLKMDLYRRDFTINTLAIRLNIAEFGMLIDHYGGQGDIQDCVIRVLHNLSFVEDPTRVFRAVRFEQRLGFHISSHTENLIKNAVKMNFLEKLGGKRLLSELIQILREKDPLPAVERMSSLGLLRFIHKELRLTGETRRVLAEAGNIVSWFDLLFLERQYEKWAVYLLALCDSLSSEQFGESCVRLSVNERYRAKLFDSRRQAVHLLDVMQKSAAKKAPVMRSDIYHWLKDLPVELLLYMMAHTTGAEVKKQISLYFTQLQNVRCLITGDDLKALGTPAGPMFKEILDAVLRARLNGGVSSVEDELRLARELTGRVKGYSETVGRYEGQ
jgi:tRNA nucleotidyltransferase (CCA-adding enzyme)